MKKKNLSALLCAAFAAAVISSFVGCGDAETKPVGGVDVTESQQDTSGQPTTAQPTAENEPTEQKEPENDVVVATVENTVMWDDENIKITAVGLTSDQYYHILKLQIENKTGSEMHVYASRTAVNSFVVEPSMGVNVPANSTADGELRIRLDYVEAGYIADVETRFHYSTADNTVSKKTERVKIETSAAAAHDYSYDESGTLLYDDNGIKIVCKGISDEGKPMIYLSSTGELSEGCCVEAYKIYVNEKEIYSDYYAWVFTNTRNLAEMELNDKYLDGTDIGEIESLKVSFKISRENLADSNAVKTELVEIPIK